MDLRERTQWIFQGYLLHETPPGGPEGAYIAPDCTIAGTGTGGRCAALSEYRQAVEQAVASWTELRLEIESSWYGERELGPEVRLVSGGGRLLGTGEGRRLDMEVTFTVAYQRRGEEWQAVHIHQSVQAPEEQEEGLYVRALSQRVREVQDLAEQMRRLAQTDSLTGLYNHRGFFEESARALEEAGTGCCMVMDLDDFKQINDTWGHLEGDKVLRRVGEAVRGAVRSGDVAGRIGGDEFAILCTGIATPRGGLRVARRIQAALGRLGEEPGGRAAGASIGIAQVKAGEDIIEALRRADKVLYWVKRNGKGRCAVEEDAGLPG